MGGMPAGASWQSGLLRNLGVRPKDLFIAAMVDGSALRADGLIADEANRLDATKAGIAVGQEQRLSDVSAWAR